MKDHKYKSYIYAGTTAFLVIAACTIVVFGFLNWIALKAGITTLNHILAPIIYGGILAYLLTPVFNKAARGTDMLLEKVVKNKSRRTSLSKAAGTIASLIVLITVIVGLIWLIIPQVINSIILIINSLPSSTEKTSRFIENALANNPVLEETVLTIYTQGIEKLITWSSTDLIPNLERLISGVYTGVISVVKMLMDFLIGVIVMVYLLNMKDSLCAQGKKGIYGLFPLEKANYMVDKFRFIHHVFGGFIIGKLLDSLIIGLICFISLSIMEMPYIVLISVIIGVTNIIPFFGPFIGAMPSALLILMVDPTQCLYFLIFILLLQQFDGNILGPKILGSSTGLPSFWVLFSILFFGGLLGPVGMIVGVPIFAVIYRLIKEQITCLLNKKDLSPYTADYHKLDYIEKESNSYIFKDEDPILPERGKAKNHESE